MASSMVELLGKKRGDELTAEDVRFIAQMLDRKVTGPAVMEDATGWHIRGLTPVADELPVLLRSIVYIDIPNVLRNKIMAQRIRYKDSPPVEGVVEAHGPEFEVFPYEGHRYASYDFARSIRPLVGDLADEVLNVNLFFAYRVRMRNGHYILEHILKLPAGVAAVDLDNIDASGGASP